MTEFAESEVNGMYVRDAVGGVINDLDENTHEMRMFFPHDTVDTFNTVFNRDCFTEGWKQRMPLLCDQHNIRAPIGRVTDAQSTHAGNELVAKFANLDEVPDARKAYSLIRDGILTDTSFGFREPHWTPHPRIKGVRACTKALMMEASPVSIGSIPGAQVTGIREEDIEMAEQSLTAQEIIAAVNAELISREDGQRMLAELDGFRGHVTIVSPEQRELNELRELARAWKKGEKPPWLNKGDGDDDDDKKRADDAEARVAELEARGGQDEYVVPEVINADAILEACHPKLREALLEARAEIAVAPEGTEFFAAGEVDTESVAMIANAVSAAQRSALDWVKDLDRRSLPDEVQQALTLVDAAAISTDALLDVLNVEGRAPKSPYSEPKNPAGSEDMAATKVKCMTCRGTGEAGDGKTCPDCNGSGIVALTRDGLPEGAPGDSMTCPACTGSGHMGDHASGRCAGCDGTGYLTPGHLAARADAENWSTRAWTDFPQSKYTPEQWRSACLVVRDGGESKGDCSLPVKEPGGTYNRNAIAAAAARLNDVQASPEMMQSAAETLGSLYRQMGEDVPLQVTNFRFVSVEDRKTMAKEGVAMPNGDFPIPDEGHLHSALGHWSTYTGDKRAAKAHILKRAKALGVTLSEDALSNRAAEGESTIPSTLPDHDGDSDDGIDPDVEEARRKKEHAMAKLGRHASKDETTKINRKGSPPDLTQTTDTGQMPVPRDHLPPNLP